MDRVLDNLWAYFLLLQFFGLCLGPELLVHILFDVMVNYWSEFRMYDLKIECQKNSTINHRPIFFSPLCANWSYAISIYGSDILVWDIGIDTLWKWLALYHFLVDTVQKFSKFIFRKNSSNLGMYLIFFNLKAFNKLFITSE